MMNTVIGHLILPTINCFSVRELSPVLDVTYTTIYNHLKYIVQKARPHELNKNHKNGRY